jgi:hypothetical protein
MHWPWQKRKPLPTIPPYPVPVAKSKPKEPGITVEEHDTSAMTQTGVYKAWKRLTGQK